MVRPQLWVTIVLIGHPDGLESQQSRGDMFCWRVRLILRSAGRGGASAASDVYKRRALCCDGGG